MVALVASSSRALTAASQAGALYVSAPFPSLHWAVTCLLGPPGFQAAYPWVVAWSIIVVMGASFTFNLKNCCLGFGGNLLISFIMLSFIGLFFFLRGALHASSRDLASTLRAYEREESKSVNGISLRFVSTSGRRRDRCYVGTCFILSAILPICTFGICVYHANIIFGYSRDYGNIIYDELVWVAIMIIIAPLVVLLIMVSTSGGCAVAVVHRRRLMHLEELLSERSPAIMLEIASLDVAPIEVRSVLARSPADVDTGCTSVSSHVLRIFGINRRTECIESPIAVTSPLSALGRPGKGAEGANTTEPQNVQAEDFLSLYHSVRREMNASAMWWTAPIILAVLCTVFFFGYACLGVIRDIISGARQVDVLMYWLYLCLYLLLVMLVPIVWLNGAWLRLVERHIDDPEATPLWTKWSTSERLLLKGYFDSHPLVFPMCGYALTWSNVYAIIGTSLTPLIIEQINLLVRRG